MSRRKGRVLAFQALFAREACEIPIETLLEFSWASPEKRDLESEDFVFARMLFLGTLEHLERIDSLIEKNLAQTWKFDRLNRVALAILRESAYSILCQEDPAPAIVIDEAIKIAKEYGAYDEYKFINAVLDNICREAGRDDGSGNNGKKDDGRDDEGA